MDDIAGGVVTGLAAKILADVLRRRYGFDAPGRITSAKRGIETDVAYGIAFVVALLVVRDIGIHAALVVAILLRVGAIVGDRVLPTSNHSFLELYLALVCLRLHDAPVALASALQVISVSLWLYAAFQKIYQREYHDGSYFYITMPRSRSRLGIWTTRFLAIPMIEGYYSAIDPSAQTSCRRLAMLVLIGESVLPIAGFATSGTIWSALMLMAVAAPVGLLSQETNFMITNILMAAMFLVPFEWSALLRGFGDPVVAAVLGWCLVWPPLHAVLARRLRFSPWRLSGWGMYSSHVPGLDVISCDGDLKPLRESGIPAQLLRDFGACRIPWLRDRIHRSFFRQRDRASDSGIVFRRYRARVDRFVTTCLVFQNKSFGSRLQSFEIHDERTADEFRRYVAALPSEPERTPHPAGTVVSGVERKPALL